MRAAIFIDGAYLLNRLIEARVEADYARLAEHLLEPLRKNGPLDLLRCYFYDCAPWMSAQPTEIEERRWKGYERFMAEIDVLDRWQVRLGKLERRREEGREFFAQKRVDVQLAVDLVRHVAAGHIQHAVIIAGDSDFIPAVVAAKDSGATVTIWCASDRTPHRELLNIADEVQYFDWKSFPCKLGGTKSGRRGRGRGRGKGDGGEAKLPAVPEIAPQEVAALDRAVDELARTGLVVDDIPAAAPEGAPRRRGRGRTKVTPVAADDAAPAVAETKRARGGAKLTAGGRAAVGTRGRGRGAVDAEAGAGEVADRDGDAGGGRSAAGARGRSSSVDSGRAAGSRASESRNTARGGESRGSSRDGGESSSPASGSESRGSSRDDEPRSPARGGERGSSRGGEPHSPARGSESRNSSRDDESRSPARGGEPRSSARGDEPRNPARGSESRGSARGSSPRSSERDAEPRSGRGDESRNPLRGNEARNPQRAAREGASLPAASVAEGPRGGHASDTSPGNASNGDSANGDAEQRPGKKRRRRGGRGRRKKQQGQAPDGG